MVPEDENKMRCVACFAVIELHSIQTEGCIIKAHKRYACLENSDITDIWVFFESWSLKLQLITVYG